MDELDIGGKKYISSKRAAELTGYAKDYVGQLARGGKIDATRVGRAWYVGRDAILALSGLAETGADSGAGPSIEETSPKADYISAVKATVSPVQPSSSKASAVSLKLLQSGLHKIPDTWGPVQYFEEEVPTLPQLSEKTARELTNEHIVFRRKSTSNSVSAARFTESQKTSSMDGMLVRKVDATIPAKAPQVVPVAAVPAQKREPKIANPDNLTPRRRSRRLPVGVWGAAGLSVTALALVWISGTVMGSVWTAGDSGMAASITADGGAWALDQGLSAIKTVLAPAITLFAAIAGSFWVFFKAGFDFIAHLVNLG